MKKLLTIGQKIRYARQEAGLSQKDLGAVILLSDKAVSAYEVGRANPSVDVLQNIGQATGRPLVYFFDETKTKELDFIYKINSIEKELEAIKKELRKEGYQI